MNSGFDKNEAELGVLVLSVPLKMLADGDSLRITSVSNGNWVLRIQSVANLLNQHINYITS